MAESYLIAHCVRGEAAFDVATKMMCPHCPGYLENQGFGCFDCEEKGFWWIIPTSGHRAWPYWSQSLTNHRFFHEDVGGSQVGEWPENIAARMPPGWPDHFKSLPAPKVDITSLFRTAQSKPHIQRRL